MNKREKKEALGAFLYILPSLVLISVFLIIPIFMDLFFSFTRYNIIQDPVWIGLENYRMIFSDPYVRASLKNTLIFTLITVPVQCFISLALAALIAYSCNNLFGDFVKSALFIPVIASAILIGNLFSMFLSPTGILNSFIKSLGCSGVNFLGSKNLSLLSVAFVSIWKNIGYFLVIFYAGIIDIPSELYEAAIVDGAGPVRSFFSITMPILRPVTYLVITLGTIWSFQVFDLVYTMTGGGPGLSTQTLVLTIYNNAFKANNMGYASTISLLMFVIVLLISLLQRRLLAREE